MPENAYSTRGWRRRNSHSPDSKIKTATTAMPNGLKVGTGGGGSPVPIMNSRSGVTFPVTLVKLETGVNSMKDWVGSTSPGSSPRELAWAPCKTLGLVEEKAVLTLFASRLLQLVESVHFGEEKLDEDQLLKVGSRAVANMRARHQVLDVGTGPIR